MSPIGARGKREYRLKIALKSDERMPGSIKNAGVIFEMMRYDHSRIEKFDPGSHLILVADHPHTLGRWASFGIAKLADIEVIP